MKGILPSKNPRLPMPSLQIRELPSDVYEALAYRAERDGRSLAQQAIVELRRALAMNRSDRGKVLSRIKERAAHEDRATFPSPEDFLREDRRR